MTEDKVTKPILRFERKRATDRRQQLIDVAIECLGEGGISAFTIDKICRKAGVSRGLVNHHFGSKDELLVCIYENMTNYVSNSLHQSLLLDQDSVGKRLRNLIDASFEDTTARRSYLRAWLALWGEISTNKRLQIAHRNQYTNYIQKLEKAVSDLAEKRKRKVDAKGIATTLIALIDGLWLEWCLDPDILSVRESKEACYDLVAAYLGPIT